MNFKICLTLLVCLFIFQKNSLAQVDEFAPEPVYLKGRIYDIISFLPISSVEISVKNERGEVVFLKSTDENGNYKLMDLEKGNYTISVDKGSEYEMTSQNVFFDNESNILMNFYLIKSSDLEQGNLIVPDAEGSSLNKSIKDQ